MAFFLLLPLIPTISSTIFKHYIEGPPKKSWDLKFHLAVTLLKNNTRFSKLPIEQLRKESVNFIIKVPPNIT
ncbi:15819_t:CDS:1, partial [Dentiscutata heterogama]